MTEFAGFSPDVFSFLMDLRFHNDRTWFEPRKEFYKKEILEPCLLLAEELAPLAQEIEPLADPRPNRIVSRIYRDARISHGIPYKDYMFLSFKPMGANNSEALSMYVYLEPECWGYGMGFYAPVPEVIERFRERLITRGDAFKQALHTPGMEVFTLSGEGYKRRRAPADMDDELALWYDKKRFYLDRECSPETAETADMVDEIRRGFTAMAPVYRFIRMGENMISDHGGEEND